MLKSNAQQVAARTGKQSTHRAAEMWTFIEWLVGILAIALPLVYFYLTWYHGYWAKRGVVTAEPLTLLGSYPGLFRGKTSFIQDIGMIYNKYRGKHRLVGTFLTRKPQILVLDPQLAHQVLVSKFSDYRDTVTSSYVTHSRDYDKYVSRNPFFAAGDEWKRRRTDAGAGITPNRLKLAYAIWEQAGGKLLDYMRRFIEERQTDVIETRDLAYRYTAQAMGDFIWGIDAGSLTGAVGEASKFQSMNSTWTSTAFQSMTGFNRTQIAPILRKLFRMRFYIQEANDFYLQLTHNAAKLRQSGTASDRSDYLGHLLHLHAKGASYDDMVGHAMTVLLEGFETSAAVIYHLLYRLGGCPEQQERLRSEILDALAADKSFGFDQLNALPYLDQCVNESLRMTSVIGFYIRICTRATTIDLGDDKQLKVEPGITVLVPAQHLHHDETYYPEPMEFKPERFDNGAANELNKRGCFLPFGDGPRICLGMRIGLLNVKMAVLRILSKYRVEQTNKLQVTADSGFGMYLSGDINLRYIKLSE